MMSKKTTIIILIISLAFNLAFVGTFLLHRMILRPGINNPMMEKPKLPIHCREDFRKLRKEVDEKHRDYLEARRRFVLSLIEEDLDEDQLLKKLDTAIEKQTLAEKEIGLSFIKLRKKMSPEEAKSFFHNNLRFHDQSERVKRGRKK